MNDRSVPPVLSFSASLAAPKKASRDAVHDLPANLPNQQIPIVFYQSAPLPCPYIKGRWERRLLIELPKTIDSAAIFTDLTAAGFRRSHHYLYRPICAGCSDCVPVRLIVADFAPNATQRRLTRVNQDLGGKVLSPSASEEQFALFAAYQQVRHSEGDMATMSYIDYENLIAASSTMTRLVELRYPSGRLAACCLIDRTSDGISAVYSFFDTEQAKRSLGTMIILWLVNYAKTQKLDYIYLGYWIHDCRKMTYKAKYQPLERLGPDGWVRWT